MSRPTSRKAKPPPRASNRPKVGVSHARKTHNTSFRNHSARGDRYRRRTLAKRASVVRSRSANQRRGAREASRKREGTLRRAVREVPQRTRRQGAQNRATAQRAGAFDRSDRESRERPPQGPDGRRPPRSDALHFKPDEAKRFRQPRSQTLAPRKAASQKLVRDSPWPKCRCSPDCAADSREHSGYSPTVS